MLGLGLALTLTLAPILPLTIFDPKFGARVRARWLGLTILKTLAPNFGSTMVRDKILIGAME